MRIRRRIGAVISALRAFEIDFRVIACLHGGMVISLELTVPHKVIKFIVHCMTVKTMGKKLAC
jgi:hypothetical protein